MPRLAISIPTAAAVASIALFAACSTGSVQNETEASAEEPNDAVPIERELDKGMAAETTNPAYRLFYSQIGAYEAVENHRVTLQPKPFTIHVLLIADATVMVNVSRDATNRDRVVEGTEPEGRVGHPVTGMAKRPYNDDKSIMADEEGSKYWVYTPDGRHSFDEVEGKEEYFVAERRVEYIFETDAEEPTPVEEFAGEQLHVVEFSPGAGPREPRTPKRAYTIQFEEQ